MKTLVIRTFRLKLFRPSDELFRFHPTDDAGRIADHDRPIRDILGNHRPGTDEGVLADGHSGHQHATPADPGRPQDPRRLTNEGQAGTPMADTLIVHRDHPGAAEDFVLDDHSTGDVHSALQRDVMADGHLAFDVDVGPNGTTLADGGVGPDHDEIADPTALSDGDIGKNHAMLSPNKRHKDLLERTE